MTLPKIILVVVIVALLVTAIGGLIYDTLGLGWEPPQYVHAQVRSPLSTQSKNYLLTQVPVYLSRRSVDSTIADGSFERYLDSMKGWEFVTIVGGKVLFKRVRK